VTSEESHFLTPIKYSASRSASPVDSCRHFYCIIILCTIAQAEALQAALTTNKDLGSFIKKLRIEGGFSNAMHTIPECTPNLTDVYLTSPLASGARTMSMGSATAFHCSIPAASLSTTWESQRNPKRLPTCWGRLCVLFRSGITGALFSSHPTEAD
jgi:hypothetical protein